MIDQQLFEWINQGLSNDVMDSFVPYLRQKETWIPLYLVGATWLILRYRLLGFLIILGALITFGLTDFISSSLLKEWIARPRPCHTAEMNDSIRLLVHCGGGYSFPSSHATNHFGLSVFLSLVLGARYRWLVYTLLLWAFIVGFSQVYVGLHYPFDILGGALLGSSIALLMYVFFTWIKSRIPKVAHASV